MEDITHEYLCHHGWERVIPYSNEEGEVYALFELRMSRSAAFRYQFTRTGKD